MNLKQFITITSADSSSYEVDALPCYVEVYQPDSDISPLSLTADIQKAFDFTDFATLWDCLEFLDVNGFECFSSDSEPFWEQSK